MVSEGSDQPLPGTARTCVLTPRTLSDRGAEHAHDPLQHPQGHDA